MTHGNKGLRSTGLRFFHLPGRRELVGLVHAVRVLATGFAAGTWSRHDRGRADGAKGPKSRPDRGRCASPSERKAHGRFPRRGAERAADRGASRTGSFGGSWPGQTVGRPGVRPGRRCTSDPSRLELLSRTIGECPPNVGPVFLRLRPRAGGARIAVANAAAGSVGELAARSGARLAQLVEHQLDTLGVASSSLAPRTIFCVADNAEAISRRRPRRGSDPSIRIGLPPFSGSHSTGAWRCQDSGVSGALRRVGWPPRSFRRILAWGRAGDKDPAARARAELRCGGAR